MKEVKMYKVMFNEYYNELVYHQNKISTAHYNSDGQYVDENGTNISMNIDKKASYETLTIPNPFLIREDEIEKYKKYGNGYCSIDYVGSVLVEE